MAFSPFKWAGSSKGKERGCIGERACGHVGLLLLLIWCCTTSLAWGPCYLDEGGEDSEWVFTRHLVGWCSEEDREKFAVPASAILSALQAGQGIHLEGVTLSGDISLDQLPLETVDVKEMAGPLVREVLERESLEEVRIIHGPLVIRNSWVEGTLATNLVSSGMLLVKGPVSITETTFERSVDFSRTVFFDPVDFSETVIRHEGFFIQTRFMDDANFERTAFGTHSRFHKAVFAGKARFTRSGFKGLAEFLEVTFEKEAGFSRTRFMMGTGFSGSRFRETLDFSEAEFEREAYFRFTEFAGDTYFRRATFKSEADFTQAKFGGVSDFTKVLFEVSPQFAGTQVPDREQQLRGLQNPQYQVWILIGLVGFVIILLLVMRKT